MGGIFKPKKGVQTTTTTQSAPAYLQPQLEFSASEARRLYDQGPREYFPGQTYVSYSDPTRRGIDLLGQAVSPEEEAATRALYDQAGGGLSGTSIAAQNQLQRTLQGDYLGITPELQKYMDVIARRSEQSYNENVLPSLRAGYGRSGAFGGSDFQQGLQTSGRDFTRELADNLSGVALKNYQAERANQQNALGLAPTYEDLAYSPALRRQQAGAALSGITQRRAQGLLSQGQMIEEERRMALQDALDRYNFNQNKNQERLALFNQNLQGANVPGTGVTTAATPYKKASFGQQILGGALAVGGGLAGGFGGGFGGGMLGNQLFGGGGQASNAVWGLPSTGNMPLGGNYRYLG